MYFLTISSSSTLSPPLRPCVPPYLLHLKGPVDLWLQDLDQPDLRELSLTPRLHTRHLSPLTVIKALLHVAREGGKERRRRGQNLGGRPSFSRLLPPSFPPTLPPSLPHLRKHATQNKWLLMHSTITSRGTSPKQQPLGREGRRGREGGKEGGRRMSREPRGYKDGPGGGSKKDE